MAIAALVTWVLAALGGFYMLGVWISKGGLRREGRAPTRFPAPVLFGHFLLAATGLIVWIVYLAVGAPALAWAALVILLPVALLGFVMLARWIPVHRARATTAAPAEQSIPVAVVVGHGLLAVVTLVLVLLTALGMG
ncbi:hypothetical protein ACTMTF_08885 [Nonomuraea sp. ZG12]|uniref:hypothetical protein n=1 Tax=Nonomuraea sp. ZG12 TaxID=3452207 RepID=UPI003F8982A8